jgi:simple sugar transport system ATP-binding protein
MRSEIQMTSDAVGALALEARGIAKRFGSCVAAEHIDLAVAPGEVHAVVGENGAGKSTLMRAIYGVEPPDEGTVAIGGEVVARPSPEESIRRRLGMVHQHFMLVPTLTVAENVALGREPRRAGVMVIDEVAREAEALGERYGLRVEAHRRVGDLSVGEAQRVEIVKALWRGAEVLILDEPTQALSPPEVDALIEVLRRLASDGKSIVLVTHKLDEVLRASTRVTVLRRGRTVATVPTSETTADALARLMVGGEVSTVERGRRRPRADAPRGGRLGCVGLSVKREDGRLAVDQVTLAVAAGEVVGVAGVEGNGQEELALALAGVVRPAAGTITLDGKDVARLGVRARRAAGLAYIPADRHGRGLALEQTVAENLLLGDRARYARAGGLWIDRRKLVADARAIVEQLDVRPPHPHARVGGMSGGNQQKIVVGRALLTRPRAIVCAQPTRGVDIGAAQRIRAALLEAAAGEEGAGILVFSSDLDELLALSDRVVVMHRGRIAGEAVLDDAALADVAALKARLGRWMLGA